MDDIRKNKLLLIGLTVAVLAPFLNKAFHIDDPLFLWMAQQIAKHPLDPYGFSVNWATFPEPMWRQMQNPPLCSYFIAAVASLIGWSEPALHFAFLFWAPLSILGTVAIARRFCREAFTAALLILFAPVFLVSATNVMCDVTLLALWLWSIECWLAGLERKRWSFFALSGVLIAAATLTKYFGLALVPLLAIYTLFQDWKNWQRLLFLLIPIAAVMAYEFWTKSKYGQGLFTYAMFYSRTVLAGSISSFAGQLLTGLAFAGGCFIAPLFYSRRVWWLALAIIAVVFAAFYFLLPIHPDWQLGSNITLVRIEGALFAAIGVGIIALAIVDLVQRRDAESLFLALWLIGTFVFAVFFNWSITARTFLPMIPCAALLVMRLVGETRQSFFVTYGRVFAVAVVSLFVATADYRQANTAREAAEVFRQRFQRETGTVWFQSHWGLQYYMQQWGAKPLNARDSEITSGDLMIVPANNTAITPIGLEKVLPPEEQNFPVFPFVSTHGRGTGAAFYTGIRGPIPWAIDHVGPEMYYVARFR
ncbi:MAG: glycosyltransferase family 39 protein [Verrucomicrobiota bacterium]|nr:glycosyltransferase family 39 protein [Verrucomicrobiota bacterium]